MNYISQIRAFYDALTVKHLSSGQISLWNALMDKCNRSGWPEWFTVANISLELSSGLSRQGIVKSRNALKQAGFIDFRSNGTKATSYRVIALYATSNSVQDSLQVGAQDSLQVGVQDSSALLNDKQKRKNTPKAPVEIPDDFVEPVRSALADWMQYKHERKETYQPTGLSKFYSMVRNKVNEHGAVAVADVITLSMASNWRGVIWDKICADGPKDGVMREDGKVYFDGKWVAV